MPTDVRINYHVVDSLPGGVPVLFAASCARGVLDIVYSRAATIDSIAAALGPMYEALTRSGVGLHAVA